MKNFYFKLIKRKGFYFVLGVIGLGLVILALSSCSSLPEVAPPQTETVETLTVVKETQVQDSLLPFELIQWENIADRIDDSEIMLLCLIGVYDPEKESSYGPKDKTPAQMLDLYLTGVRNLGYLNNNYRNPEIDYHSCVNLFIVECGEENRNQPTREKALFLAKQFGVIGYESDQSIPAIFVFHNGNFLHLYTYLNSPGKEGVILRDLVNITITNVVD
jgi:hypothetical protein